MKHTSRDRVEQYIIESKMSQVKIFLIIASKTSKKIKFSL